MERNIPKWQLSRWQHVDKVNIGMARNPYASTLLALRDLESVLICKVCQKILEDPILVGKCEHVFCKKCITKYLGNNCPECHVPVAAKDSHDDTQLNVLLSLTHQLKQIITADQSFCGTDDNAHHETSECSSKPDVTISYNPVQKTSSSVQMNCNLSETLLSEADVCATPKSKAVYTAAEVQANLKCLQIQGMETPKSAQSSKRKSLVSAGRTSSKENINLSTPSSSHGISTKHSSERKGIAFSPGYKEKRNAKGETMLHVATIKGNISKVKELLQLGANPNVKDNAGWTPLHEASNHGFKEIVELLLDYGAYANVPGHSNITPLHDAILNGRMEIAQYLASRGADIQARTSDGFTALDMCHTEEMRISLQQSCSLHINTAVIPPDPQLSENNSKIVLLPTGLDEPQRNELHNCALLLKAYIVNEFGPEVTHIIAACDNMGQCYRTFKVLNGILSGKWIVNFQWVEVCLEYKQKVDEEVFEVPGMKQQPDTHGPQRARLNKQQQFPPLFDGCHFYLHGQFTSPAPTREDLCHLIHQGGGKVLSREPRSETVGQVKHMIPYHANGNHLKDISHFILYQDEPPRKFNVRYEHICTVSVFWLIECIGSFKLLDPSDESH